MPFIDVTAAAMLTELEGDLRRDGVALVVAGDVGRVRDVERRAAARRRSPGGPLSDGRRRGHGAGAPR